ncbi:MAG: outer membrane protein assembly factor BamB, partial [Nitrosomonadaceae bacterium]|nr:outer membrane protein assembly factor BamB [Nitrosomonadaceae bacterium]
GSKDINTKKDEVSEPETITSVPPLWESSVGDSDYDDFSARDAVDDVISLSFRIGTSVTGTTALVPVFHNDAVYAASASGQLTRFDSATGSEVWSINTYSMLSGGVGVNDEMVLVGTFKGEVLAFDDQSNLLWRSQVTSEILSPPQVDDGVVVVRTGEGRIFGLDAVNGERKWVYQSSKPSLTVRSFAGVLVKGGAVFAGFAGGKLAAIQLSDGKVAWEVAVSKARGVTELERITDITSLPVADEKQICAVAYKGRVTCFEITNGNQIWTRDTSSSAGLAMDNKYVYVSEDDGSVVAYNKNNGTIIWKKKIPKREVKRFAEFTLTSAGEPGRSAQYSGTATKGSKKDSSMWDFLGLDSESNDNEEDDWEQSDRPDIRMEEGGFLGSFIVRKFGGGDDKVLVNKLSAPFVYGSQVVVGDSQGYVTILKYDDGAIVSQSETDGGAILTRPEHVPNGLVVQTINGGLYAFSIQ